MGHMQGFRARATAQADEMLQAIALAEGIIVTTIERECEALRSGRMLAARALHLRLCDAARLYLAAARAARASIWTIERLMPGIAAALEERRADFAVLLRVELAVLAAERAALRDVQDAAPCISRERRPPRMPAAPGPMSRRPPASATRRRAG